MATWTKIAEWLEAEYGVQIHRTTIQKWFDKNHWEPEDELLVNEEGTENRIKLDKKLATYKGEAKYYKKLYDGLLKDTIKQEVIIETIQDYTKGFPSIPLKHLNNSDKTPFGHEKQIAY